MRPAAPLVTLLLLLAGCFGDAAVAPSVAPLEVVANGAAPEGERCTLNRYEVGVGVHEVLLLSEGGEVTVSITDSAGNGVLESSVDAGGAASTSVDLAEGAYVVTCSWSGEREQVDLRVS